MSWSPDTPLAIPLLGLAMACALAATAPAVARADDAPADADPAPARAVSLVRTSTWLDPDGEIEIAVELAPGLPPDATVEVTVHEAMRHRTDFRRSLDRTRLGGRLTTRSLGEVGDLDPSGQGAPVTIRIPIRSGPPTPDEPPRLGIANPGVLPVDVSIVEPDGARLGGLVTYVVRPPLDHDGDTTKVVLVQLLDAPPSHRVDGSASVDRDTRERWTVIASALDGEPVLPIVLAARPEAFDALSTGSPLDRGLVATLAEAAAAGAVPIRPYVAVDLDGALRAGLVEELDDLLDRGTHALERALGVSPEPGLWIAGSDLTTLALGWLVERGIDTVIVPHDALVPVDDDDPHDRPSNRPVRLSAAGSSGTVALVTDPVLQAHQGSTGDPLLDAQHLAADLALDWFDDPESPRAVVIVLRDDGDPRFLEALRAELAASPLLEVSTPATAVASTPLATVTTTTGSTRPLVRRLVSDTSRTDLTQLRRDLDLARLSMASVRSVFPGDDQLFARYDTVLAVLISSHLTRADRSDHLAELATEMGGLLDGISLPARRAITLPARDGTIPITLTNTSGRTALVAMHLASDKLEFADGERVEVSLPVGTTTVEIEVRARASGAFPLEIALESPDGHIELGSARYTVRSTAVSGLGVAISAAAVVVLGVWWVRTSRRARAAHTDHRGRSAG